MSCNECRRVVDSLTGYCERQRPMGDLDLECFDCTWAHEEIPGCQRILALTIAHHEPRAVDGVRHVMPRGAPLTQCS